MAGAQDTPIGNWLERFTWADVPTGGSVDLTRRRDGEDTSILTLAYRGENRLQPLRVQFVDEDAKSRAPRAAEGDDPEAAGGWDECWLFTVGFVVVFQCSSIHRHS